MKILDDDMYRAYSVLAAERVEPAGRLGLSQTWRMGLARLKKVVARALSA